MGKAIRFAEAGGEGYLSEPAGDQGAIRGVVVIQEWWGLNDHIRDVTDRFADAGFLGLAPDLYHGVLTSSPDEAGKLLMALQIDEAERDLRDAVEYLRSRTGHPVGVVGFCMGGALSLFTACASGSGVGACVVYYGGHPKVTYDFDGLQAPVLGHWAEHDDFANASVKPIEDALATRGKPYEFHRYLGTRHAFFNDTRPAVYDLDAAGQSWQRTLRFLRENLH
jgi:carboxymethylenebutenolidase